jgi:hypothetical protein
VHPFVFTVISEAKEIFQTLDARFNPRVSLVVRHY